MISSQKKIAMAIISPLDSFCSQFADMNTGGLSVWDLE